MKKKGAVLIGFMPNPRIYKRIALEKEILDISLICWDKGSNMLPPPKEDGYTAHIIKIGAGGNPLKRLGPYARFCKKAGRLLRDIRPDLIHVQGLDMLKIAVAYKKAAGLDVAIIYEVADLHQLIVDPPKSPVRWAAQCYLIHEDRRCAKEADLLIVTSPQYIDKYFHAFVPAEKTMYIPNVPNLEAFRGYQKKVRGEPLVVGYIGGIRYKRQMRNLLTAAKRCGVKLMIAGFENEPVEIEPLCKGNPDIEWVGRFDFNSQASALYGKCDLMYSVYDADMENVRVALPNKLYESVYCEMPIIVAKGTYLAEIVSQWGVGVAVDHRNPEDLTKELEKLVNFPDYYDKFVKNCSDHKDEVDLARYNAALKSWIANRLLLDGNGEALR